MDLCHVRNLVQYYSYILYWQNRHCALGLECQRQVVVIQCVNYH